MTFIAAYVIAAAVYISILFYLLGREDGRRAQLNEFYEKRYRKGYK